MGRPPTDETWDEAPPDRPRVLLECPPEETPFVVAKVLEDQGYAVRVCEGPDRRHPCSLLHDGACELVSGADVVVNLFSPNDPERREVLGAITDERRPPEVVTQLAVPEIRRRTAEDDWWFDRDGAEVIERPLTRQSLVSAVDEALRRAELPRPVWGDGFC